MLYFPKLNVLNHGFYGLRDFADVFCDTLIWFWESLSAVVLNQDLQDFEGYE
jgi:hypothetical protein